MGAEAFGRHPVGTGPMVFSNWVTGDRLEFTINDKYWGDKIAYDSLIVRFITEASSRAIELESGGVDVAFELSSSDWSRIDESKTAKLITGDSLTTTFLTLNSSIKPLDDMRVREALAYGTDVKNLVSTVWQNSADPATSYYAASLIGHEDVGPHDYDPEKAKQLLADAGYPNGLTIKYYLYDNTVNTAVAEVLQSMWKQIGVTIDLQVVDVATFTSLNNNGEITIAHMSTTAAIPDPSAALVIWPTSRTISVRHNDKHVDELLDKGKATYDEAERASIYKELQEYLWSKTYTIPIAYSQAAYGASSKITNFPFYENLVPDLTRIQFNS
jgi:peptide/nickel transport system substrate-binding protein